MSHELMQETDRRYVPQTTAILKTKCSKTVRRSKISIANKGMNGVIGMRAPSITASQVAIKDAETPKIKIKRPIREKEMVSTDQRYQLAVIILLEGFQHTLNR